MNKGFSIIELLIVIAITLIVASGIYTLYSQFLREFKGESESIQTQIEKNIAFELIRLDLEHAGFGIVSTNDLPLEWDENNKKLTIRSTLNNANQKTIGFVVVDCTSGAWPANFTAGKCNDASAGINCDKRKDIENNNLVFINAATQAYVGTGTFGTCPASQPLIGLPYDPNTGNDCTTQYCYRVIYYLSNTQPYSHCNPNTRNLLRAVGGGVGQPVLSCVSDFKIRFALDNDGDGKIDETTDVLPSSPNGIKQKVKLINFYVLQQESGLNKNYTFNQSTTIDGIQLNLPSGYEHYRWKIYKISVKPMNF